MFFAKDSGIRDQGTPINMLIAMGWRLSCVSGSAYFQGPSIVFCPLRSTSAPYTGDHVTSALGILMFTRAGFFMLLKLDPEPNISADTDWVYRKKAAVCSCGL